MVDWHKTAFLAHASEDKEIIRKLYDHLEDNGIEPWLDEKSLHPGVNWDLKIKEAIHSSHFFLACLTKTSTTKQGYVQDELRMALNELAKKKESDIYFIPVLMEEVELPDIEVAGRKISDYQCSKYYIEKEKSRLVKTLQLEIQKPDFKSIRSLIANNEVADALQKVNSQTNQKFKADIISLLMRHKDLTKKNNRGLIEFQPFLKTMNQIIYDLLTLIDEMETE